MSRFALRAAPLAGAALAALIASAAEPARALQMQAPPVATPQIVPNTPQIRPHLRPRIVVPQVRIDPDVARRVLPQAQAQPPRPSAAAPAARRDRIAPQHAAARPALVAVLPPTRPADLDETIAEAAQARRLAEARAAAEAALLAAVSVEAADLGRFADPLARDAGPAGPSAAEREAARRWDAMRGRDGGVDALGLIADLGLPSNRRAGAEPPGLRPDPTRLPTGGLAAQDGDIASRTQETTGNTVVTKTVYATGAVDVTKATVDGDGAYAHTVRSDAEGNVVLEAIDIQARSGARREITRFPDGSRMERDIGSNGAVIRDEDIPAPRDIDRLLTGEEQGGGWCPPSGWGCSGPVAAPDALAGGGTRVLPPGPGEEAVVGAPRLALDPHALVVNPHPDAHAAGGGGGPSARAFDGGRLVNPGDAD